MWLSMALLSAVLLGIYDVVKKKSLSKNSVLYVLLGTTALSCLFLSPFFPEGSGREHIIIALKSILVTISWISGLIALKLLPISTASTLKASRPMFVTIFAILLFGERLNGWQWAGVILSMTALFLLSGSSKKEGISFSKNKGVAAMAVSILFGVCSALLDKKLLATMAPLFVQCWTNLYILAELAIIVAVKALRDGKDREKFHWDPMLLLVAALIVCSDALYFHALKQEGSLISVISIARRFSVVVTFFVGALAFKEKHLAPKAAELALLLCGVVLLTIGS